MSEKSQDETKVSVRPDRKVVQCNYRVSTSICATGASAYLTYEGDCERVKVVARSRSGRWVTRWESLNKLHNFRLKTICPDDHLYAKDTPIAFDFWSQEQGQRA